MLSSAWSITVSHLATGSGHVKFQAWKIPGEKRELAEGRRGRNKVCWSEFTQVWCQVAQHPLLSPTAIIWCEQRTWGSWGSELERGLLWAADHCTPDAFWRTSSRNFHVGKELPPGCLAPPSSAGSPSAVLHHPAQIQSHNIQCRPPRSPMSLFCSYSVQPTKTTPLNSFHLSHQVETCLEIISLCLCLLGFSILLIKRKNNNIRKGFEIDHNLTCLPVTRSLAVS